MEDNKNKNLSAASSQLKKTSIKEINGGVTAPKQFKASGIAAGLKKRNKKDLSLIYSLVPSVGAGVFTTNLYAAAPVQWCKKVLGGKTCCIITNSGNANACTGKKGFDNAEEMAEATAALLGIDKKQVFVCSTGVIGVYLPMPAVLAGIPKAVEALSGRGSKACAEAIMTTDTYMKEFAVEYKQGGHAIRVGGIAKGSGMIHPNMATMLCYITTDAAIGQKALQAAVKLTADKTFNMVTVDGDTSTNDTLLTLANGAAGNADIKEGGEGWYEFCEALHSVCLYLAKAIAADGEGATKLLEVEVIGANLQEDANKIAKAVAGSSLVKAAFFGEDANWGRIICAAGYSGAQFLPDLVAVDLVSAAGTIPVMRSGAGIKFSEEQAKKVLAEKEIKICISLYDGDYSAMAWGCDLTYDYVKINGSYRS